MSIGTIITVRKVVVNTLCKLLFALEDAMKFGERIKDLRESQKYTQQQVADALGVTQRTLAYYESGERSPNKEMLVKIASFYHVTPDDLLAQEDSFELEAEERFGNRAKADVNRLLRETRNLFAGGDLPEADKESFFKAMTEIYFESKERSRAKRQKR